MERTVRAGPRNALLIAAYLAAIVVANLIVAAYGQKALVWTAVVLIPFDLFSRDLLHEAWHGRQLRLKMAALVAAGSLLSFALSFAAWRVALASCLSFALAATTDTLVYSLMAARSRRARMIVSNSASAVVDSIAFPLVAFGALSLALSAAQALMKVGGGFAWVGLYFALKRARSKA